MKKPPLEGEELIERVSRVGGIVLGVSDNRSWVEIFYEGDHTHIKSVELPGDIPLFDIFVEEIQCDHRRRAKLYRPSVRSRAGVGSPGSTD